MQLPRALAPWATYLDLFPLELALALGPLVQRLALAVGPLQAASALDTGDPDGFDGLARRGPYERLVHSEWLLADEVPLEFERRAAMGEHAFLQLARREPATARASIALFDAGPNQYGAPRIAHLAMLIVLARRAEAAGLSFRWGVLQQPDTPLYAELNERSVLQLLAARSIFEVRDDYFRTWHAKLVDLGPQDDLWLIGGRRLRQLPQDRRWSLLQVEEADDPDVRRLEVAVQRGNNHAGPAGSGPIILDLPDQSESVRLLRDPFGVSIAPHRRIVKSFMPLSNLVWAGHAKLLARVDGGVVVYSVPNSPRGGVGKPKLFYTGQEPVVAAGRSQQSIMAVTVTNDKQLRVVYSGRSPHIQPGIVPLPDQFAWSDRDADPLLAPCWVTTQAWAGLNMVLPDARILRLNTTGAEIAATNVIAVRPTQTNMVYITRHEGEWRAVVNQVHASSPRTYVVPCSEQASRAFIGFGGGTEQPLYGLFAVEQAADQWIVVCQVGELPLTPPRGSRVVGVIGLSSKGIRPGLVVLADDERTLLIEGHDWTHTLPRAPAPIAHVTVSKDVPAIAYTTVRGDVLVYSVQYEAILLQLAAGD